MQIDSFVNFEKLWFCRVNVGEHGVCYRLYPQSLFDEKINENVNAEMARQPLLVSCCSSLMSYDQGKFRKISCKQNYSLGQIVPSQNSC